jgi:hypothetical protein
MPQMQRQLDPMAAGGVVCGVLAAVVGLASGLVAAVVGQAAGSLAGGCGWIGAALPIHRQVWALVNQPTLDFASRPEALGYWLGSLVLPLLIAVGTVPLLPRRKTLSGELLAIQISWGATAVGIAWLPLIDPVDGHIARWLQLGGRPGGLMWLAPILAVPVAVPPALRLLALVRNVRPHTGRWQRLAVVGVHLAVPGALWAVPVGVLLGSPAMPATLGMAVPVLVTAVVAWFGYPAPYPYRLRPLDVADGLRLAVVALLLVFLLWVCGRPQPGGGCSAILWGKPSSYNNIRQWIEPVSIPFPWASDAPPADASATEAVPRHSRK